MSEQLNPILRFAPSPNGELHLGHAYSALLNMQLARKLEGTIRLRIEDIDLERCSPALEKQMLKDLEWIGFEWEGNIIRQSDRLDVYRAILDELEQEGWVYPAAMSRGEVRRTANLEEERTGKAWPRDPDNVPHYPGQERNFSFAERGRYKQEHETYALRLDMVKVTSSIRHPISFEESGGGYRGEVGLIFTDPKEWGDVLLGRKDVRASYHLCCVIDDAEMNVDLVVRGRDLFSSTSVQRLLQELLTLPVPTYHHHDLILGDDGKKLSKSKRDTSLRQLREAGYTRSDIQRLIGLESY